MHRTGSRRCWRRRCLCWLPSAGAVDGYLARRMHRVTTLGGLLSPLADQLLLSTAYIALVRYAPELLPAWLAVLMVGREFMVTGLCAVAVQERMTLGVRDIGKGKTALQTISVVAVLMAHAWPRWQVGSAAYAARRGDRRGHSVADAGGFPAFGLCLLPRLLAGGAATEPAAARSNSVCGQAGYGRASITTANRIARMNDFPAEYSDEERRWLLRLAHASIRAAVRGKTFDAQARITPMPNICARRAERLSRCMKTASCAAASG